MATGIFVTADKEARDHCVVVVKGTFQTDSRGELTLAAEQRPPSPIDEHFGEPALTAVKHACDFVLEKPMTEVLVVGKAVAPGGVPVESLLVRLEVQGRRKDALVTGDRHWVYAAGGVTATRPLAFREMPLTFDRAFGGSMDLENPIGAGLASSVRELDGQRLPNIEDPLRPLRAGGQRTPAWGFGPLGRAWAARLRWAGTYDQRWLAEVAPYLPADFDPRYHLGAPDDQWFPHFVGGELIHCVHMAAEPVVTYRIPSLSMPVRFEFANRTMNRTAVLDTVVLEPHDAVAMLVWRASVPLGKKLTSLHGVSVGPQPVDADGMVGRRNGKPVFGGLRAMARWQRKQRRSAS